MAEPTQYLDETGLSHYDTKSKSFNEKTYVKRQKVAGQEEREMGLSDNNLTDELLQKIKNAGDSSFTGNYEDLHDKPTLDGNTIEGALTSEGLGLAKSEKVAQDIEDAKDEMEEYVDSKLSSTYKPAGSVENLTGLPSLTKDELGNVYNVKASFVTNDNFIEGSGHDYPAGTNVVIVETDSEVYKYDALSGFVDLSDYMEKTDISAIPNSKIDALFPES